jgi:hypothetical protein
MRGPPALNQGEPRRIVRFRGFQKQYGSAYPRVHQYPPTGFERFFAEVAEEWAQPEPDMSRIMTISEKYGLHSVDQ